MQCKAGGVADPFGQAVTEFFSVWPHAGQNRALGVGDGDRVARRDFGGDSVAVQSVDRIFGHQRAAETTRLLQRNHQLQHGRVTVFAQSLVIKGFACGPRAQKQHIMVRVAAQCRVGKGLGVPHRGGSGGGTDAAGFVQPGQALDLGIPVQNHIDAHAHFFGAGFAVGDFPTQAAELLLPFGQPLAQRLLRILHVAFDGFLVAGHFFDPQVGQRSDDGQEKNQHRGQRRQHRQPVLPRWIELAPPPAQAAGNRPTQLGLHGGCTVLGMGGV